MKQIYKLMAFSALLIGGVAATGCQDQFDDVEIQTPVATLEPNITIAEFKALFWQNDAANYCDEIPAREDGTHYIVSGRVVSSDYEGNVFKKLVIQDETAALTMSINQYNLYLTHRVGQELVIDLTGMYAGKYASMFQLGFPSWYESGNTWQTSFMAPELFNSHCELNGLPEPEKIDTVLIENFGSIGSSPEELQKWQGQLVRLNNVSFVNGGKEGEQLCANYKTSVSAEQNQTLNTGDSQLTVRTSGYCTFWNTPLPADNFDIVGILDCFNGTWQLILNDAEGLMNIGEPTNKGGKEQPYTVTEAIALADGTSSVSGWVEGVIVGTVAPEVTDVTSIGDVWTTEPFIMNNTLVIAPKATDYSFGELMVITLPQGTPLAEYGNLVDNPTNLGKTIKIQGRIEKQMSMPAVANNTGAVSTFVIQGVEIDDPNAPVEAGDGTESAPYNVTQVIGLGNPGTAAWVEGYIVGWYNYDNNSALETSASGAVATCLALAASPDETDKNKTVAVQLPVGDIRTALNLADHPENLGKKLTIQGSLIKYFGLPGIKDATAYKLNGEGNGGSTTPDTPDTPSAGSGDGTQASPYNCAAVISLGNPGTAAWVKGYIVGWYNYDNNSALETSASGAVATCVALADNPGETDKNKTVAIQLPVGDIRTAVNLADHPENLGKMLTIQGSLIKYFGLPGVKDATAYSLEGSGSSTPDTPDTPTPPADVNGDGTEASPYDVNAVIALNQLDGATKGWAEGYIVGSIKNSAPVFGAAGAANTNLLIAQSADETDIAKCVPVELPSGKLRTELNLVDHADYIGKKIQIEGTFTKYFSRAGIKAPSAYKML